MNRVKTLLCIGYRKKHFQKEYSKFQHDFKDNDLNLKRETGLC